MKRILPAALALLLLAGCTAQAPTPASSSPAAENQNSAPAAPVTEEDIYTLYETDGYQIQKLTPYGSDFLAEVSYGNDTDFTLLEWVFGSSGRRVQLTALSQFTGYEILDAGQVRYTTNGLDSGTPWQGMPEEVTVRVLGDENGVLVPGWWEIEEQRGTVWLDPAQPLFIGASENGTPVFSDRYEQLYDARIDADGLSFSFIPNGDSTEKFYSFFPAVTTIPGFSTAFDPDSRVFTLRLYNTCLESGTPNSPLNKNLDTMGYPKDLYHYSFPAGSLGRDSHFLTDATIAQDGADVVVSAKLTEQAFRFTVESSNLGYDNIPSFRLIFREHHNDLDGRE